VIARKKAPEVREKGLKCPDCGGDTEVKKTRPATGGIRRKRVCVNPECGRDFQTYERPAFTPEETPK
jgi:transcriptional regulator NrdR family protein